MKEFYSIGETAALLGVSTQTLRYYDKIGLLSPHYVDNENRYYFYCCDQFHIIDRIKYMQSLGLPLEGIQDIMQNGKVNKLLTCLKQKQDETKRDLIELSSQLNNFQRYVKENPDLPVVEMDSAEGERNCGKVLIEDILSGNIIKNKEVNPNAADRPAIEPH